MVSLIKHLCCWLCCTILALPQGWCCMVVECCRAAPPPSTPPTEHTPPPCGCCSKGKTCCGTSPAGTHCPGLPERKAPPTRCWLCDRDATKPKSSTASDLDIAGLTLAFPPLLTDLPAEGLQAAHFPPLIPNHPSLCKLHCVWTC